MISNNYFILEKNVAARKLIVDGDSNENIGNTQFA
jgi:hypothetical protein